jgi:uroporphyrin-III C-methyltransferase / precorrin-2 dehydrogenase / sirohydrochlorin ferrochelatase
MNMTPIFARLADQPVLLVGAGMVARRKASALARGGAKLIVVAPDVSPDIEAIVAESGGEIHRQPYDESFMEGVHWVIAATDSAAVNVDVYHHAVARKAQINVVDRPDLCSFTLPSVVHRDPLLIAIGSGGASPVLTRMIRTRIESAIPARFGDLANVMAKFRQQVKQRLPHLTLRRRLWQNVVDGPVAEAVFSGNPTLAERLLVESIEAAEQQTSLPGEVFLVGAGPGDPDLLTIKALRCMQLADVVLYDNLVSQAILDLTRADAERIYVGKRANLHAMPQEQISQFLVDLAKAGKRVLRLKGGDPFIFGRGGEEIDLLAQHRIPFQVVPGVTAAAGCGAYAGIPLTHRDCAQSVRFITGHLARDESELPWEELVQPFQTVVFYMGLLGLPKIVQQLQAHGLPKTHPIALIEKGTLPEQRVVCGSLADIVAKVDAAQIAGPTLIIMGDVVALRDKLKWFDADS